MKTKKYKEFINESIKDLMTGKSDEEIQAVLDDMNILERYKKSVSGEIPKGYKPTEQELIDNIDEVEEYAQGIGYSYDDLFGGIKDEDFDYIIDEIKKIKEKKLNNTISSQEVVLLEGMFTMFDRVEKAKDKFPYHMIDTDYGVPFDSRRYGFIEGNTKLFGGKKIVKMLKDRKNKKE